MSTSPSNTAAGESAPRPACRSVQPTPMVLPEGLAATRAFAIRVLRSKWVNGTILHYHFLEGAGWSWPDTQKDVVRDAFGQWKGLGIGLSFVETDDPTEAEVRIGFDQADGSWSAIGTGVLHYSDRGRTTNYGWDLTDAWGRATALHEIGHVIGLDHEHQSSKAGITWNEPRVYDYFSRPPNSWTPDMIFQNIIRKVEAAAVDGSEWDPASIMEYPFLPGLILAPPPYDRDGIGENTGLSPQDIDWTKRFYPPLPGATPISVMDFQRLDPTSGAQSDFLFEPAATREYTVRTIGRSDSKIVIFVERGGEPRHLAAADDSGIAANAEIATKMVKGERYIIRVRTHFADAPDGLGLIIN